MILISHRGNLFGRNEETENTLKQIDRCLNAGLDVEIDVRYIDGKWFLGHDNPDYNIDLSFLIKNKDKLWCHAKNISALEEMMKTGLHCFWHQEDTCTLTSKGYIWAYTGKQPIKNSIAVMPEIGNDNVECCIGVCSDVVERYRN